MLNKDKEKKAKVAKYSPKDAKKANKIASKMNPSTEKNLTSTAKKVKAPKTLKPTPMKKTDIQVRTPKFQKS